MFIRYFKLESVTVFSSALSLFSSIFFMKIEVILVWNLYLKAIHASR